MKLILGLALASSLLTFAANAQAVEPEKTQQINSFEQLQLYCSKQALHYNSQSPGCVKYYLGNVDFSVSGEERIGMDREFKKFYLLQLQDLKTALDSVDAARSIQQLQRASDSLSKTIKELEKIPADAIVYPSVRQTLAEAYQHRNNVDFWLSKEYRARYQVLRARVLMAEAAEQTEKAVTLSDYRVAKAKWEGVQQLLSSVPLGVFITEDVKTMQAFANVQQNNVIAQINAVSPVRLPRQEVQLIPVGLR